jgi:hypothetical protein
LLTAFAATEDGVLRGACDALRTPRTLGPLRDIARTAGGELARVMAADSARYDRFSAFLDVLAAGRTVVVKDVHWADEATLDGLIFAGRRLGGTAGLLIVTYRDDELGPGHPLGAAAGSGARSPPRRTSRACRALNAVGSAQWFTEPERAEPTLLRGLEVARRACDDGAAASALANLGSGAGEIRRYDVAERWLRECAAWCEQRDLDGHHRYAHGVAGPRVLRTAAGGRGARRHAARPDGPEPHRRTHRARPPPRTPRRAGRGGGPR